MVATTTYSAPNLPKFPLARYLKNQPAAVADRELYYAPLHIAYAAGSSVPQRFNPKTSLAAWLLQSPLRATTIDIPAHFVSGDDPIV